MWLYCVDENLINSSYRMFKLKGGEVLYILLWYTLIGIIFSITGAKCVHIK